MSAGWETIVGLEIHVQLATRTKMFCGCANTYGAPPNTNVCPTCLGLPGALPVPNREAIALGIRAGLGLGCAIATRTRFDRKSYFYPDLPKGYQISQLQYPINGPGELDAPGAGPVRITRAHLEEDAGKSVHEQAPGLTLIDLNRCGVPLLEIVTEPDLRTSDAAGRWLTELRLLMRHLGVGDCDMEKGSLRCDVNVSVRPEGEEGLRTKVELKNLNSFKMAQKAIDHEVPRQIEVWESGGTVLAETRLWDDERGVTRLMRSKEEMADYRYFPDPDLLPIDVDPAWIAAIRSAIPETPAARRARYTSDHGLSEYDIGVLIQDVAVADYFDAAVAAGAPAKRVANWITGEMFGWLNDEGRTLADVALSPAGLGALIGLVADGTLSSGAARQVFTEIVATDEDARVVARRLGVVQVNDSGALEDLVDRAIEANPVAVAEVRSGKGKAAGAIVGWIMKETGGSANPRMIQELLARKLS